MHIYYHIIVHIRQLSLWEIDRTIMYYIMVDKSLKHLRTVFPPLVLRIQIVTALKFGLIKVVESLE